MQNPGRSKTFAKKKISKVDDDNMSMNSEEFNDDLKHRQTFAAVSRNKGKEIQLSNMSNDDQERLITTPVANNLYAQTTMQKNNMDDIFNIQNAMADGDETTLYEDDSEK